MHLAASRRQADDKYSLSSEGVNGLGSTLELGFSEDTGAIEVLLIV